MMAPERVREASWWRRRRWEVLFWFAAPACVALLFPDYMVLASQIAAAGLFALSLDLLVGYAGLLSLGHAAFFGVGAYTAGILSQRGWGEPLSGLLAAGVAAGMLGFVTSFVVVRVRHLAQLMVTLGIGLLVFEGASRLRAYTGGDDGLQGMNMWSLFGVFPFDLYGHTAFAYAFVVLLVCFIVLTRIIDSPFGLTLQGLRDNPRRMAAVGTPGPARLRKAYTMAAVFAGIAGGLLAQTTQFVALETLSFHLSAEVLIMLVLGGAGYRYGGLVGAAVYMVARDWFAEINPEFWQLGIGAVMVLVVLFAPDGVLGGLDRLRRRFARDGKEQA